MPPLQKSGGIMFCPCEQTNWNLGGWCLGVSNVF